MKWIVGYCQEEWGGFAFAKKWTTNVYNSEKKAKKEYEKLKAIEYPNCMGEPRINELFLAEVIKFRK